MRNKEAKKLLKMVDDIKLYIIMQSHITSTSHQRAINKVFDLEKKLTGYRNLFYGSGNPSWSEVAIPFNELEINVLIELVKNINFEEMKK